MVCLLQDSICKVCHLYFKDISKSYNGVEDEVVWTILAVISFSSLTIDLMIMTEILAS